jgi:hypothetical protein
MSRIAHHAGNAPTANADHHFRIHIHVRLFRYFLDLKQYDWVRTFSNGCQDDLAVRQFFHAFPNLISPSVVAL